MMLAAESAKFDRRRQLGRALAAALAWQGLGSARATSEQAPVVVAVAADMRYALDDLIEAFRKTKPTMAASSLRASVGASGSLAQQVRLGAPLHIFLSADEETVVNLARDGYSSAHPQNQGQALVVRKSSGKEPDWGPWKSLLVQANKISLANPEHAPYGRAAKQWLVQQGLQATEKNWVLGDNVSQALQFVVSGAAPVGLVAYSLLAPVRLQAMGAVAHGLVVKKLRDLPGSPEYPVLIQKSLLLKAATQMLAIEFYQFLHSASARTILQMHGFS
jgi:molybdate transport system substrate-binding protein